MRPELGFLYKRKHCGKNRLFEIFSKGPGMIAGEGDFTYGGHQSPGSWHVFLFFAVNQRWAYLPEDLAILTKCGDSEHSRGGRKALSFRGPEGVPLCASSPGGDCVTFHCGSHSLGHTAQRVPLCVFKMLNAFGQSKPPEAAIILVHALRERIPEQILGVTPRLSIPASGLSNASSLSCPSKTKHPWGRLQGLGKRPSHFHVEIIPDLFSGQ